MMTEDEFVESIQELKDMFPNFAEDYLTNILLSFGNLRGSVESLLNTPPPASQKEYC